jgi:diguanylate cyclase (GGDEF)-like protein
MRLSRLLLASILAFFTLVFISVIAVHVYNARLYIQDQLQSHAQDAATAFGLSLSPALQKNDLVLAELIVRAAFDRGYYQDIRILSPDDKVLLVKSLPLSAPGVPAWFVKIAPLHAPSGESLISSGWRQLGRVIVTSHPNFAYRLLWRTSIESFYSLAALFVIAFALLSLLLKAILRPLRDIEAAAIAVSGRNFQIIPRMPKLLELRRVAEAFNDMSSKIRRIVEEESGRAEQFHREAYEDTLTGLENRRSFEPRFAEMLNDRNVDSGVIMMLEVVDFRGFNRKHGFQRGDELLRQVGESIATIAPTLPGIRARINGGTFVMSFPNVTAADAEGIAADFCRRLGAKFAEQGLSDASFACGVAHFEDRTQSGALLAAADRAMLNSTQDGPNGYHMVTTAGLAAEGKGSSYWRAAIDRALEENLLALVAQPILSADGTLYQREVMARMADEEGNWLPAADFFPMAARHGLSGQLDRKLLTLLLDGIEGEAVLDGGTAFNVSIHSLRDREFCDWLFRTLRDRPQVASQVVFELAEFGIEINEMEVLSFVADLRKVKGRFAIDHFGLSKGAIRCLSVFMPDYVKLSGAYSKGLAEDRGNQFFIAAVARISRPLGIRVIAQFVENAETWGLLKDQGVDAYQGFFAGKPLPFRAGNT